MIILGEKSIHVARLMGTIVGHIQCQKLGRDEVKSRHSDFDMMMMMMMMVVGVGVVVAVVY